MNICIPVMEDGGLQSAVSPHFGSAPAFLIVDTETDQCRAVVNRNQHHSHGMCQPLSSLQNQGIGAIVVGGIGMGALTRLQAEGLDVFLAHLPTAGEIVQAFKAGRLEKATPATACAHHGSDCRSGTPAA
jgi:predicted Fe-Mo cluster-binding NifX family protein